MGYSRASKNLLHYGSQLGKKVKDLVKGTFYNIMEVPTREFKNLTSKEYYQKAIEKLKK